MSPLVPPYYLSREMVGDWVRAIIAAYPGIEDHLGGPALALARGGIKAVAGTPAEINSAYHDRIAGALFDYLGGNERRLSPARNEFKKAAADAFTDSFDLGWIDGGQHLPVSDDANTWLGARLDQELGYIDMLFEQARQLKKDPDFDAAAWISQKADSYTGTLTSIYNAGKMFAKGGQVLTWRLGNTEKHCKTCASLNGKSHRASWYIARNYIPRSPGASMECGGYECDCHLEDKQGNEVTIV